MKDGCIREEVGKVDRMTDFVRTEDIKWSVAMTNMNIMLSSKHLKIRHTKKIDNMIR